MDRETYRNYFKFLDYNEENGIEGSILEDRNGRQYLLTNVALHTITILPVFVSTIGIPKFKILGEKKKVSIEDIVIYSYVQSSRAFLYYCSRYDHIFVNDQELVIRYYPSDDYSDFYKIVFGVEIGTTSNAVLKALKEKLKIEVGDIMIKDACYLVIDIKDNMTTCIRVENAFLKTEEDLKELNVIPHTFESVLLSTLIYASRKYSHVDEKEARLLYTKWRLVNA